MDFGGKRRGRMDGEMDAGNTKNWTLCQGLEGGWEYLPSCRRWEGREVEERGCGEVGWEGLR